MTPLGAEIRRMIEADGPVSLARVMALSNARYYADGRPFGAAGDFTTAPEISQVFGELVGVWAASVWQAMGAPERVLLVELGPGRGTMMADMLRAARVLPAFRAAIELHLVETSPVLRARQAKALGAAEAVWHDDLDGVPAGPLIVVANEFFDALPIHQFVHGRDGWRERVVGLDEDNRLVFGLSPLLPRVPGAPGEVLDTLPLEVSPVSWDVARRLGARLARDGGAALIVDYGYPYGGWGDTLQAVKRHAFTPVLENLGEADITAHVDFAALARAAREGGARTYGSIEQRVLLSALGIAERAARLAANATPQQAADIASAVARLTKPGLIGMGGLFRALALVHPDLPVPAGFSAEEEP